ncbi:CsbA family protein [Cytobacillus sp. S13-E01]|uniref:CsbA family protein n=1 Tax=Cytobacillus sp. S13-E01 TaxID=3031326 RepID=UPI0023D8676F|nr:CsbA family protein [Cytobacillus sp. S13-E01]MDF0728275.1 CsbA family protein [Cytobacillus sp. S13-E01]
MILKLILALILPCLLVILFTRVTYNHYVGTLLAISLLVAAVYQGYTDTIIIGVIDVISLTGGFLYSKNMMFKMRTKA